MPEPKRFAKSKDEIRELLPPMGGCFATDRIMVDGLPVGYMYREAVSGSGEFADNGWRFFSGDESRTYLDEASHTGIYALNTVANYDPDIIPYLNSPAPCAFEKVTGTRNYRPVDPPITE